jgi:hypothetical protein
MSKKVAETRIPRAMNTMLKPMTKPIAVMASFGLEAFAPSPTPPRMLKYEGINGNTHGDRNESTPAAKTKSRGKSSIIFVIIVL